MEIDELWKREGGVTAYLYSGERAGYTYERGVKELGGDHRKVIQVDIKNGNKWDMVNGHDLGTLAREYNASNPPGRSRPGTSSFMTPRNEENAQGSSDEEDSDSSGSNSDVSSEDDTSDVSDLDKFEEAYADFGALTAGVDPRTMERDCSGEDSLTSAVFARFVMARTAWEKKKQTRHEYILNGTWHSHRNFPCGLYTTQYPRPEVFLMAPLLPACVCTLLITFWFNL